MRISEPQLPSEQEKIKLILRQRQRSKLRCKLYLTNIEKEKQQEAYKVDDTYSLRKKEGAPMAMPENLTKYRQKKTPFFNKPRSININKSGEKFE